jgi:uncharacterized membrane protein YccC
MCGMSRFSIGLLIGSAVSGAVWYWWWQWFDQANHGNGAWVLLTVPTVKLLGSVVCFCFPRWREFGLGLLASILIGCLVFIGIFFAINKIVPI